MELEEKILTILEREFDVRITKNCPYCTALDAILAAVKASGMVEVCENQEMPPVPNYEVAHIVMERDRLLLTPVRDEAGRRTAWKRVYCEKPEGK